MQLMAIATNKNHHLVYAYFAMTTPSQLFTEYLQCTKHEPSVLPI